jgi:hypothetical protein
MALLTLRYYVNQTEGVLLKRERVSGREIPSPILFNLVVDIITRMLKKAVAAGLIRGLGSDLVENGVVCLQYADDTILFLDANEKVVKKYEVDTYLL